MSYPSLPDLEAFVAIARHRSFHAAAAERGVSRSALSHAMRALEERLGVRLLNRTTRSVVPTEAGARLLILLEPAMHSIGHALDEISRFQEVPCGTLRLNVPRPAARMLLAHFLPRFLAAYPLIQVEVVTDDGLVDIVGQGFDAGIRFDESLAGDMIATPISKPLRFAVVASPEYLKKHGIPIVPEDLKQHACIGRRFPRGNCYAWEFQRQEYSLSIAVSGPLVLDDDDIMVQAALNSVGIAYVYADRVQDAVSEGKLVLLLDEWSPPASPFYLYYPSRRQMPLSLRVFIDMIKQSI